MKKVLESIILISLATRLLSCSNKSSIEVLNELKYESAAGYSKLELPPKLKYNPLGNEYLVSFKCQHGLFALETNEKNSKDLASIIDKRQEVNLLYNDALMVTRNNNNRIVNTEYYGHNIHRINDIVIKKLTPVIATGG